MKEKVKKKKLYKFGVGNLYALTIFLSLLIIGTIVVIFLNPKENIALIIFIIVFAIVIICLFVGKYFEPIIFTQDKIIYNKIEYDKENIRITLLPRQSKSSYHYLMVFGEDYLNGENLRAQVKNGFYVNLNVYNLNFILNFYEYKFSILDVNEVVEVPKMRQKIIATPKERKIILEKVKEHNEKY